MGVVLCRIYAGSAHISGRCVGWQRDSGGYTDVLQGYSPRNESVMLTTTESTITRKRAIFETVSTILFAIGMGWGFPWWVAIVFPCIAMLFTVLRGHYDETEKISFLSFSLIMITYLMLKY